MFGGVVFFAGWRNRAQIIRRCASATADSLLSRWRQSERRIGEEFAKFRKLFDGAISLVSDSTTSAWADVEAFRWRDLFEMRRGEVLVAIAVKSYALQHGSIPQGLDMLVPTFLPAIPPDEFDGKPVRYALRGGQAVVYSVGPDLVNDGGRPMRNRMWSASMPMVPLRLGPGEMGDWLLYPLAADQPK